MDVVTLLCSTIESLKYPYYLQGTFSGENYPDSFITYIINSSDDRAHYDDKTSSWTWNATVIFYTKDPALLATVPELIRTTLQSVGFIPTGKGYNIFSDDPNFTGWTNEFLFLDK